MSTLSLDGTAQSHSKIKSQTKSFKGRVNITFIVQELLWIRETKDKEAPECCIKIKEVTRFLNETKESGTFLSDVARG